jgi:periplasmic divalent cation tolerance protein
MTEMLMVFVMCDGREQAEYIADKLVSERLAACVNVLPEIRSCYVWEGKLTWSDELMLLIKTTQANFDALKERVTALHSYEIPEIVGIPIEAISQKYLEWVQGSVHAFSK